MKALAAAVVAEAAAAAAKWAFVVVEKEEAQLVHYLQWEFGPCPFVGAGFAAVGATPRLKGSFLMGIRN
jgi:hypothetical protein